MVTGGAGFIGSHTCVELLDAGYDVVGLAIGHVKFAYYTEKNQGTEAVKLGKGIYSVLDAIGYLKVRIVSRSRITT